MLHRPQLPRLLPVTIVVMAALLGLKSVTLVRAAAPPAKVAPATSEASQAPPDTPIAACPPARRESPAERQLLLDLHQRSTLLQQRAAALDLRESVLKAAEKKLSERVAELATLQKKLASESAQRQQQDAAKWRALVELYQNMRPRSAAAIFDGLPMAVLLGVMSRMNERKAAPILAAMQPDKARALTARLAALPGAANGGGT